MKCKCDSNCNIHTVLTLSTDGRHYHADHIPIHYSCDTVYVLLFFGVLNVHQRVRTSQRDWYPSCTRNAKIHAGPRLHLRGLCDDHFSIASGNRGWSCRCVHHVCSTQPVRCSANACGRALDGNACNVYSCIFLRND